MAGKSEEHLPLYRVRIRQLKVLNTPTLRRGGLLRWLNGDVQWLNEAAILVPYEEGDQV